MLAKSLARRGFEIATAENGREALEQFSEFKPDVAVVDIGLPELNGYEVARAIRKKTEFNQTLLVALTGYGQQAERQKVIKSGFDYHLIKPLQFEQLNRLIEKHAGKVDNHA